MLMEPGSLSRTINDASRGNQAAAFFLASIYHAIDLWDDLIDKDVPYDDGRVNSVFEFFLVHLPENPWYMANAAKLQPVMRAFIVSWHTGNVQKKSNPEQTYILRQLFYDLVTAVAALSGGLEHAKQINLRLWQESAEYMSLTQYKEKDNGLLGS